jgi:peptidoglycan hydrolase-like protein with peptidoglycan-binding domain
MPFHSFTSSPISHRTTDPFGRLMAESSPDPEIMEFKNPFRLGNPVSLEGRNGRRDIAKVENLLGRVGALNLNKTDGVTGYFGAHTGEAVKEFQKDRGLKTDGLINPNGPTLKTLVAEAGGSSGTNQPIAATSEQPPTDPRSQNAKRIARRYKMVLPQKGEPANQNPQNRLQIETQRVYWTIF